MPLLVKGRRPGPDQEQLLDWLASLWVEAEEVGKALRAVGTKAQRQDEWLDANRNHERYASRANQAFATKKELERLWCKLHRLSSDANRLVDKMDAETKKRAVEEIHAWSAIGGPGLEAMAWGLDLDPAWLEEDR